MVQKKGVKNKVTGYYWGGGIVYLAQKKNKKIIINANKKIKINANKKLTLKMTTSHPQQELHNKKLPLLFINISKKYPNLHHLSCFKCFCAYNNWQH